MSKPLERARALLEEVTPLATDCGQVCSGRCCRPSADGVGMFLFPTEEELVAEGEFTLTPTDHGTLLTCNGTCNRALRPLACRIFPLFPYVTMEGRVKAVYDPRAYRVCPLVRECAHVPLSREFVRAVRRAGRILMEDSACAEFLRQGSREIDELERLLPLQNERPPIARRKP